MNEKFILIKPQENCGMCGYIWQTIRGIFHNPNKKYYIDFSNSIYKSKIDNRNIWDDFFHQPHINSKPSNEEIEKIVGIIFDQESNFIWDEITPNTKEEIEKRRLIFNSIIKNYIKPLPHIQNKIDNFYNKNMKNKKVLGVHVRGTDHPGKKNIWNYLQPIKEKLVNYDKILVCSDDYERFRLTEIAFKNKFISYDALRSKESNKPLHSNPINAINRNNNQDYQYKIAEDVIIEAFLMSKVDFLFCCPGSNVNYFSRCINPNLESIEL